MNLFFRTILLSSIFVSQGWIVTNASEHKIVSWNIRKIGSIERLHKRLKNFSELVKKEEPDILVFIEVSGKIEIEVIIEQLGWEQFNGVVSKWGGGLEVSVISKIPFEKVIEYDVSPDGINEVFDQNGKVIGLNSEQIFSSDKIPYFGNKFAEGDRGTMRVDLDNGLSIFPVHLKADTNKICSGFNKTIKYLERNKFSVDPKLADAYLNGTQKSSELVYKNAKKRERTMAATARLATVALREGKIPVILGDFNTGFEKGKHGIAYSDCDLQIHSCEQGSFPAKACSNGDGYDDTIGMLQEGLVSNQKWKILSENLGRTYNRKIYADLAIDHIAVLLEHSDYFTEAVKSKKLYGSDHYAVSTIFNKPDDK